MSSTIHRLRPGARGNETISSVPSRSERDAMISAASIKIAELFDVLRIDHENDHNTRETPRRVAKMFVEEIFRGRYELPPTITEFENVSDFNSLIITGPIDLRSTCAHHLMPIYGRVFLGILPAESGKIVGLSKYDRIVDYFASRLQIQEELVKQIGQYIADATAPRGLAIRISAVHMCKTQRGVRAGHSSRMVSTAYYGAFAADKSLTHQFLQECLALERGSQP
jgi:GTP cyclohydrolase I